MIEHLQLGDSNFKRSRQLQLMIASGEIILAGNKKLKIYGRLLCSAGKRMNPDNRIFFTSEKEALLNGFRPCGHCRKTDYQLWKMDLFNSNTVTNILPQDGIVEYHGKILKQPEAQHYFEALLHSIQWKNDEAVIFGRHIITKRKVAWYGDNGYAYTYSNTTKEALPWTEELLKLKAMADSISGTIFNSCLLNLYHNGDEGMAWHSDDEKCLGENTVIASLSLGAERKFALKHKKDKHSLSIILENGSLLVMKGATQTNWLHSLPKTKKVTRPRVNLTFRTIIDQQ